MNTVGVWDWSLPWSRLYNLAQGTTAWVDQQEQYERLLAAEADMLLPVEVPPPVGGILGQLGRVIQRAIEAKLHRCGAAAGPTATGGDPDLILSEQLYRARLVERRGLFLLVPDLSPLADASGALSPEDSAVLRFWIGACRTHPVRLCLDAANRELSVYATPEPLAELLEPLEEESPAPESAAQEDPTRESEASDDVAREDPALEALAPDVELSQALFESPTPPAELAEAPAASPVDEQAADVKAAEDSPAPAPSEPETRAQRVEDVEAFVDCAAWIRELGQAQGPKPLSVIERMFVSSYVPLSGAVASGFSDPRAEAALKDWAVAFEQSYSEAFDALCARGRRPNMVLDAPEIALKLARLHGARSTQLVLVDGLRFDLGLRVQNQLKVLLGPNAAHTERLLLWSALPATTAVQLELIGRGPAALREPLVHDESSVPVAHGRGASLLRRVKTGHRELLKLDLVESELCAPGGPLSARLDQLAVDTAEALANHMLKLPPKTLVFVFGDHGFLLDPLDGGTTRGRSGGASPEEVLVPAFAWLMSSVH